jgi:His-Xaa-Ser system radical SAM maturase HxsC
MQDPDGFKAVLTKLEDNTLAKFAGDVFQVSDEYNYFDEGDILRLNPVSGAMRCLFRATARSNTILLTEQCNHYCLMCSQPPKRLDDSWLLKEAFELIKLIPKNSRELIFSGGEPTLYGPALVELLHHVKRSLPDTAVHLLSNGRAFKDREFTRLYAAVQHPDLMIGIPIYSDDSVTHDYVVQSRGAFDDTIRGILNLKKHNQRVEIRLVVHQQTVSRLLETCKFLTRNLLFVDHVALMALEITGFTKPNLQLLWIDPYEYKDALSEAVALLNAYGMPTSVYNHQLCTVNADVFPNYRKSISDWKTEYLDECSACKRRNDCGGFFSSGKAYKHSDHIRAFN